MDIQTKIGQRIKELRTEKNLTQEGVAFKAEIDRTYMNHVENGRKNISVESLAKIAHQGLGISFQDFFNAAIFSDLA